MSLARGSGCSPSSPPPMLAISNLQIERKSRHANHRNHGKQHPRWVARSISGERPVCDVDEADRAQIHKLYKSQAGTPGQHSRPRVTISLGEDAALRDLQDVTRHADPRTIRHYDKNRNSFNLHPNYRLPAHSNPEGPSGQGVLAGRRADRTRKVISYR